MNILVRNSSLKSVYIGRSCFIERPGSVIHILYGWLVKILIKLSIHPLLLICPFVYLSIHSLIYFQYDSPMFVMASFAAAFIIYMMPASVVLHLMSAAIAVLYCGIYCRQQRRDCTLIMRRAPRLPCITSDVP